MQLITDSHSLKKAKEVVIERGGDPHRALMHMYLCRARILGNFMQKDVFNAKFEHKVLISIERMILALQEVVLAFHDDKFIEFTLDSETNVSEINAWNNGALLSLYPDNSPPAGVLVERQTQDVDQLATKINGLDIIERTQSALYSS